MSFRSEWPQGTSSVQRTPFRKAREISHCLAILFLIIDREHDILAVLTDLDFAVPLEFRKRHASQVWAVSSRDLARSTRGRPAFKHRTPECRHALIGGVVRRLQRHIDVAIGANEQRHVGQHGPDGEMLQIDFNLRPGRVARHGKRFVGGQIVSWTPRSTRAVFGKGAINEFGTLSRIELQHPCKEFGIGSLPDGRQRVVFSLRLWELDRNRRQLDFQL